MNFSQTGEKMIRNNNIGFSLIEVLIGLTVFSLFMAIFAVSQGYNLSDSTQMKEEIKVKTLCETVVNGLIVTPPEFSESLTLTSETKTFEDDPNYDYTITYKKLTIPDIAKIQGQEEQGEDKSSSVAMRLMEKVKENLEKIIWQVEVKVTNKSTKQFYKLSTWLYNDKTEVKFGI
jgi:prepilin-type N-terminal cleavage/methylation domain-containing protein